MDNVTTEKLNQILKSTDSLESFLSQSKGMQMDMRSDPKKLDNNST